MKFETFTNAVCVDLWHQSWGVVKLSSLYFWLQDKNTSEEHKVEPIKIYLYLTCLVWLCLELCLLTEPYLSRPEGIIDFDDFTGLMLDRWAVSKIKQSCLIPYVLVLLTYDSSNST